MIICHKHKFIFIKPRKVAGTSVYLSLSEFCESEDSISYLLPYNENFDDSIYKDVYKNYMLNGINLTGHSSANKIKEYIDDKYWNEYTKVSIIRNPWDTEISRYYWMLSNKEIPEKTTFDDYMNGYYKKIHTSNDISYFIKEKMILDFVINYDNLESDYHNFLEFKKLPKNILPKTKNKTRKDKRHYSFYFKDNDNWINSVRKRNIKTIEYFGFKY